MQDILLLLIAFVLLILISTMVARWAGQQATPERVRRRARRQATTRLARVRTRLARLELDMQEAEHLRRFYVARCASLEVLEEVLEADDRDLCPVRTILREAGAQVAPGA